MAHTIPLRDWLRRLDDEYVSTFIKDGGASIKFAVLEEDRKPEFSEVMESRCAELEYAVVKLDAVETKVHMPQDVFFGLAKQVDWRFLARCMIVRLAGGIGYDVNAINPSETTNVFGVIAKINGLESQSVLHELRRELETRVTKEYRMDKDFRVAMTSLCLCENVRPDQEYGGQPLIDWLTGMNTRLSSVKSFFINTGINRTTARHFIESALFWFRHVGYAGTVILLDNSRILLPKNPKDGSRYYTKVMVMDHYELLREFIDGTDQLAGTLVVIVTNSAFLDEDPRSRGFGTYQALRTRIMDDVRDKTLVNPVASLVRLS